MFLISVAVLVVAVPSAGPLSMSAEASPTSWTIMLYMAANASPELPWEQNLNDMEAAGQAQGTNIIALVEPFGENTTLYKVAHDPGGVNSVIVSQTINDGGTIIPSPSNDANMGSPQTLDSFIGFSAANYPADRYVLILWGHGAAWRGLCPDGSDILTLPELRSALADATAGMHRSLDIVCVDACAEATLEMLFEVWGYVDYFVGSEKDIPTQGLPYSRIFNDLAANVDRSAQEFGVTIAEDYLSWSRTYSAYSATMAVFNMTTVYPLMNQFKEWVEVGTKLEGLFHSNMQTVFSAAEHYEIEWQDDFGDIGNHVSQATVPIELRTRFDDVLAVYRESHVYAGSFDNADAADGVRARESTGAVIFCPSSDLVDQSYADLQISSTGWMTLSHMLRRTAESNASVDSPWLSYGSAENYGAGLFDTAYVNWLNSYAWLDVWVFREQPDGLVFCSLFSGSGNNVTVHGNHVAGDLVFSASAGNDTSALSYAQLGPAPITGVLNLVIALANVTGQGELISVMISVGNDTIFANATDNGSHELLIELLTPQNLTVGETIEVQVDLGQRMSGTGSAVVTTATTRVTVEMHENHEEPSNLDGLTLLLVMTVLAACLILIFVVLMRRERKENGG